MNMLVRPDYAHKVQLFDFNRGDRVEYKHAVYRWMSTTNTGYWFQRVDDDLPPEFFTYQAVSQAINSDRDPMGYLPCRRSHPSNDNVSESELLSNLKPAQQQEVLEKHEWCVRFLRDEAADDLLSRSEAKLSDYLSKTQARLQKESDDRHKAAGKTHRTAPQLPAAPSPRSLRRWVQKFEEGNFDPIALLNKSNAKYRREYFTPDELEHINKHVWMYASKDRPPIKELHAKLRQAVDTANQQRRQKNIEFGATVLKDLRVPDIDTFTSRIHKLPRSHTALGRHGKDHATTRYSAIMEGVDAVRPLERVEIDECLVDLQTLLIQAEEWEKLSQKERDVVARVRLYVTAAKDVATKCLVGLRIHHTAPNAASAISALEMVMRDKTYLANSIGCETPWDMDGIPGEIAVDSATWLASKELRIATNDVGGCLFQPKAGDAGARGTLERWFRTLNRQALLFFTGRTWGSTDEKGDQDAEKEASLVFHKAAELLTRFVVDVFHNTPHAGLNGETPREAWHRLRKFYKPTPPLSPRLRRSVFGIKVSRKVSRSGIRVLGIQYTSSKLQALFRASDEDVEVRLDRFDLGAISVRHPEGWLTVPASHEEFAGMSLWKWLAFNQRLNLTNRKNAEVPLEIARRTKEWLRDQAQIAQAEAELGSSILTERDIIRFEKNVAYQVDFVDCKRTEQQAQIEEADISSLIKQWDMHGIQQSAENAQTQKAVAKTPPAPASGSLLDPDFNL
ncbi:Mu transposase C-terminal domain-containing protein [Neorhizobium galegae]|uniref:Mu transposase C-terminal domain-containing protein n=1 Tax=Neorhizobium galegae TaxID=399 RepID=UPI0021061C09|nr:Mu transposase C-terminal domain-containing protein [Neorhizobium galegae]MCQ1839169.1 Mu transposase C-terminal domain-containing protein [Neorhizobium galegae]